MNRMLTRSRAYDAADTRPQWWDFDYTWVLPALLGLVGFLVIAWAVVSHVAGHDDRLLELDVHRVFGLSSFPVFETITNIGGTVARTGLLAILVVLLCLRRLLRSAAFLLVAQIGSLVGQVVKMLTDRPRPHLFNGALHASGYSFPSGHSLSAVLLFGALGYLLWTWLGGRGPAIVASSASAVCVVLIGLSRVVLGVHYPTDVLGGFSLGIAWLSATIVLLGPAVRMELRPVAAAERGSD